MADKVRYSINVTPIEEVQEHYGFTTGDEDVNILTNNTTRITEVIATEVQQTLGCSSDNIALAASYETNTNSLNGFASGTAYILTAPANTTATVLPTLAACDLLYLEHTGYQQASSGAAETDTVNTTDYLTVATAATSGIIVAILKAGEGVVLPMRGVTNANVFYIRSSQANGTAAGTQGTVGCKFLSVT